MVATLHIFGFVFIPWPFVLIIFWCSVLLNNLHRILPYILGLLRLIHIWKHSSHNRHYFNSIVKNLFSILDPQFIGILLSALSFA